MSAVAVAPTLLSERTPSSSVPTSSPVDETFVREQVAQLAYSLWEGRGCPENSAEVDWLEAEQQLRSGAPK